MKIQIEVPEGQTAAAQVLSALCTAGMLSIDEDVAPSAVCPLCASPVEPAKTHNHPHLPEGICPACKQAAERLDAQFSEDLRKHVQEFRAQFARLVLDVRSGAEVPTWYRGFE